MKQAFRGIYVIVWIIFEVILKAIVMGVLKKLHIGSHEWHKKHYIKTMKEFKNAILYASEGAPLNPNGQVKLNWLLDAIDSEIQLYDVK